MSGIDNILEGIDDKFEGTADPRDWGKPSLAVIACTERKFGVVLWYVGAHVESMIEGIGGHDIEELGFEDEPPIGISVWEGRTVGGRYNSYTGDYDDAMLKGTYRAPTEDEWRAIREGRCPWNADEWLLPGAAST